MDSYPNFEDVAADFGDKVMEGLATAVRLVRTDLATYRSTFPGWVAESSDRGLANWIHDRLWSHLVRLLDDNPSVSFTDLGATRELWVGTRYRLRAKRHLDDGHVSNYPTATVLEFFEQEQGTLDGLDEVRLIAGYIWDPEQREVTAPVLSLRDGQDHVIWQIQLDEHGGTQTAGVVSPSPVEPQIPNVEIAAPDQVEDTGDGPS